MDAAPAVGTGVMTSQPLGEARNVMRMRARTSHHPNLGDNQTQLSIITDYIVVKMWRKCDNVKIIATDLNLLPLHQLLEIAWAGDIFAFLHLPHRHPSLHLNILKGRKGGKGGWV